MAVRPSPHNLEAEKSVLGSCFLSNNALLMTIEALDETDFYDARHAKIFTASGFINPSITATAPAYPPKESS